MKLATAVLAGAALLAASAASAQTVGDHEAGEKVAKKCVACHDLEGDKKKVGPYLHDVFGRTAGSVEGFKYSVGLQKLHDEGLVWNEETLAQYLPSPKDMVEKSKMTFKLTKEKDIADIIAYLKHISEDD